MAERLFETGFKSLFDRCNSPDYCSVSAYGENAIKRDLIVPGPIESKIPIVPASSERENRTGKLLLSNLRVPVARPDNRAFIFTKLESKQPCFPIFVFSSEGRRHAAEARNKLFVHAGAVQAYEVSAIKFPRARIIRVSSIFMFPR